MEKLDIQSINDLRSNETFALESSKMVVKINF